MLSVGHHGAPPTADRNRGITLVEVLVTIVILGIIAAPLASAFSTGLSSTATLADVIAKTDDAERILTLWVHDVQSVAADGVNADTCGTLQSGETRLVSFTWGTATGSGPKVTTTWSVIGSGPTATLARNRCPAGGSQSTNRVAGSFMDARTSALAAVHGPSTSSPGTFCSASSCTIVIDGNERYAVTANRKVSPSGTPTTSGGRSLLNAVSDFNATNALAAGADCSLYLSTSTTQYQKLATPAGCTSDLYDVIAVSSSAAYAVGANGTILRCSSSCNTTSAAWSIVPAPAGVGSASLYSIDASIQGGTPPSRQADRVMAVGANGTVVVCKASCATSSAGWAKVSSATLGTRTLTSVSMHQRTNANSPDVWGSGNGVAYITARGIADVAANKGTLLKCLSSCLNTNGTWQLATGDLPNGTGQLIAVAAWPLGNGSVGFFVGDAGKLLSCVNCSSSPSIGSYTSGSSGDLTSVGVQANYTVAVGYNGDVVGCSVGSSSTIDACRTTWQLRRNVGFKISGLTRTSDTKIAFLVGADGTFMRFDATTGTASAYVALTLVP